MLTSVRNTLPAVTSRSVDPSPVVRWIVLGLHCNPLLMRIRHSQTVQREILDNLQPRRDFALS